MWEFMTFNLPSFCLFSKTTRSSPAQVTGFEIAFPSSTWPCSTLPTPIFRPVTPGEAIWVMPSLCAQWLVPYTPHPTPSTGKWSGHSSNMHPIFEGLFPRVILGPNYCVSHMTLKSNRRSYGVSNLDKCCFYRVIRWTNNKCCTPSLRGGQLSFHVF